MASERVVVLSGPLSGRTYDIDADLTIGRGPENGLQLNDLQISRKHAVIQRTPAGTIIRDLGSGNGTYIGDRRILEYRLSPGDLIRIGPLELQFESEGPAESRPVTPSAAPDSGVRFGGDPGSTMQATSAEGIYQTFFSAPKEASTVDQLRKIQERLAAVYEANQIIASERDLNKLFERVIDQIFRLVPAHNGVILMQDERAGELRTEYVRSGSDDDGEITISSQIVRQAVENREAIITYDAAGDDRFESGASIITQNISSAMCAPLVHQGEALGAVYVDTRGTTNAFAQGDLELLVALAGPSATAIKNAQYLAQIEQAYRDTLVVLANAIELRDHYTVGHTWRVTNFALETAKVLGWPEAKLEEAKMGGVLHDVGKIAIEDAILRKPGGLDDEEYAKMKVHPERGARMMQDVAFLVPLIPYALYHHERYDGKGYPYGLKGEDIPIEGRLLAVADTFDAMTSNRPYRKGLDPEIAIAEIEKGRGTQFDPEIADAFIKAYRDGRIRRILQDYHKSDGKSIACPFCSTHLPVQPGSKVGDEYDCSVCHRRIRLRFQNDAYYGELVAATDASLSATPPRGTK